MRGNFRKHMTSTAKNRSATLKKNQRQNPTNLSMNKTWHKNAPPIYKRKLLLRI